MHPLLQKMISCIKDLGVGEVVVTPDGHLFFQPCVGIEYLRGAIDEKKEGEKYGVRVILRQVRKRAKNSKYAGLPWFQIYMLPIVKKNAKTMTDAERRNMEQYAQALKMAHAVERDPEQAAKYHELHEAHKKNPEGYKKLYPNFFGFLVATFRMELAKAENHIRLCVANGDERRKNRRIICKCQNFFVPLHRINKIVPCYTLFHQPCIRKTWVFRLNYPRCG